MSVFPVSTALFLHPLLEPFQMNGRAYVCPLADLLHSIVGFHGKRYQPVVDRNHFRARGHCER